MILGRLLMRLLLVPLGGAIAVAAAMLVVVAAEWNRFVAVAPIDGNAWAFLFSVSVLSLAIVFMLWPAVVGALLAEAFAIRSWMYHAAVGGLSAWISLVAVGADEKFDLSGQPMIAIAAGVVAGFAYWAVAGWSAGFWKPVFAPPPEQRKTAGS